MVLSLFLKLIKWGKGNRTEILRKTIKIWKWGSGRISSCKELYTPVENNKVNCDAVLK